MRTLQTSDGKANQVGTFDVLTGDYRNLFQVLDAYRRVTPADVQRVVQQYFRPTRRPVVTLVPEAPPEAREAGAAGQAKADRTG